MGDPISTIGAVAAPFAKQGVEKLIGGSNPIADAAVNNVVPSLTKMAIGKKDQKDFDVPDYLSNTGSDALNSIIKSRKDQESQSGRYSDTQGIYRPIDFKSAFKIGR